jgi:hypothetical protein
MGIMPGRTAYRTGAAIALAAGLLQLYVNLAVGIVGDSDNPSNQGFYGVVVTALACAFTARFRAEGMARAMLATAATQALLGAAVATAPVHAAEAGRVLVLSSGFAALWLLSAFCFHRGARGDSAAPSPA